MRGWGRLVGRNGADVRTTWGVSGVGWGRAENGWRGKVTAFRGYGEQMGWSWARGRGRGVRRIGRGTLAKRYGEREAMAEGSELGAGAGCSRERRFWARLVICNRLLVRNALAQSRPTVLTWQSNTNWVEYSQKVSTLLKWAAIGDIPPFTRTTWFEFDERVNVFIGPNAVGKSTILRHLTVMDVDVSDGEHPRFFVGSDKKISPVTRTVHTAYDELASHIFGERIEPDMREFEALRRRARILSRRVPVIHVPATRLNIPLSADLSGIQEMLKRMGDEHDLSEVLAEPPSWEVFNGGDVYHAARVINEGLISGEYSGRKREEMVRVSNLPYECAQSICTDALDGDDRQQDWIQYMPAELRDREEFSVATVHHDMAVSTPHEPDANVFVGDLSSGTQGTLLWIWYLALQIAVFHNFRRAWNSQPAILLIDEIENHLHPTWQRRVIPALLKYFPGLQIFATTHSPFVIAGLKTGQVHLLSRNNEGTVVASTNEQDIVGWTADEILRTFMGVQDPTDELTATNAARLRVLRRKDALEGLDDHEQAELDDLRTKAGADILAQGGMLNAQRERFADMVQEFLKARLADTPPDEA